MAAPRPRAEPLRPAPRCLRATRSLIMKTILLWAVGVPIPIILLLYAFTDVL